MDLNLDTLKTEIQGYLENSGFAIFRSTPGGLEGLPLVIWDAEKFPDYQMFLETARKAGVQLVMFASRQLERAEIDEVREELEDCDLSPEERRGYERKLREVQVFEGSTCSIELAFDLHGRIYVYELRPDWYEEFADTCEEIEAQLPEEQEDGLGGYFSNN